MKLVMLIINQTLNYIKMDIKNVIIIKNFKFNPKIFLNLKIKSRESMLKAFVGFYNTILKDAFHGVGSIHSIMLLLQVILKE